MMSAIERLNASITSNRKDGIGMIKTKQHITDIIQHLNLSF